MKMTIVTDTQGALLGAVQGAVEPPDTSAVPDTVEQFRCGIVAGEGQQVRVVDVPDQIAKLAQPAEFHTALQAHLATIR